MRTTARTATTRARSGGIARITATVLTALAVAATGVLVAAPAQARDGTNMYLLPDPSNTGPVGVSTLNGWTFDQKGSTTRTDTSTSAWSARAVHTSRGRCVQEHSSYWNPSQGRWRWLSNTVHTYTTANGGWRTLDAAAFGQINGGEFTTKTTLTLLDDCG